MRKGAEGGGGAGGVGGMKGREKEWGRGLGKRAFYSQYPMPVPWVHMAHGTVCIPGVEGRQQR